MVYDFSHYHPELQGQFAGICRYTNSITCPCINLTEVSVQTVLHLRHPFDRNHHIPKPNKIPIYASWVLTAPFCSRKDQTHPAGYLLSKKTPSPQTFLVFDCLHLSICKEQQRGGIMPSCCPCELQFYYFIVSFFLYIKSRQHRKRQCKASSELSYPYSLTGRVRGGGRRLISSYN